MSPDPDDEYFSYMQKADEAHAMLGPRVMYSPLLARGREDPRYQEILDRIRRRTGRGA